MKNLQESAEVKKMEDARGPAAAPVKAADSVRGLNEKNINPVHILIVDDDEAFGKMLENVIIKMAGFRCTFARGARDALKILKGKAADVVVTDIKMPDMNGLELTRVIKEKYNSDIIVMTGYNENFTYEEAIAYGANDFIEKPVRPTELVIRLKRVLRERSALNKRRQAEEEREFSVEQLRKALGATVQALALTAEIRDPYTAGHQRRVADLARALATGMGLSADQINGIRMASAIHDIGKVSVPAEILSKPGKLTNIEFSLIKNHTQTGYDILKDIEFPWPIARMVMEHHERVDGSGYPNMLKGDKLLIESRIIAVCDVVEAIASHRPYRPALGIDLALEEIIRNRGTSYDCEVVDVCLRLFRSEGYKLAS